MQLEIHRLGIDALTAESRSCRAAIDDYLRNGLFFALWRHRLDADRIQVDLRAPGSGNATHHCAIAGALHGVGAFHVEGAGADPTDAIDRALHRLEMWVIKKLLDRQLPCALAA